MPMRWTQASASLICSSRCRHTRQNSGGDGRGPVAFRKSGDEAAYAFQTMGRSCKPTAASASTTRKAQMHFCSDAEVGQDRASGVDRVLSNFFVSFVSFVAQK